MSFVLPCTLEELCTKKVAELKSYCRESGISMTGTKSILVEKLCNLYRTGLDPPAIESMSSIQAGSTDHLAMLRLKDNKKRMISSDEVVIDEYVDPSAKRKYGFVSKITQV